MKRTIFYLGIEKEIYEFSAYEIRGALIEKYKIDVKNKNIEFELTDDLLAGGYAGKLTLTFEKILEGK